MATIHDWNKYQNLLHELALVEDDLRTVASETTHYDAHAVAERILYERF